MVFADRAVAGRLLAERLRGLSGPGCLVLGLARGGVPVAAEVAAGLGALLDALVVRKLGVPGDPELAIGAIASGGGRMLRDDALRRLGVTAEQAARVEAVERAALERREALYRAARPAVSPAGKDVVLVDDGLATGATMTAAARSVRAAGPRRLIVAVPVGSAQACAELRAEADEVVCLHAPTSFGSVGAFYDDFEPVTDEEVGRLLSAGHS